VTIAEHLAWPGRPDLLPPAHLRLYYYRTLSPARFQRACDDVRTELTLAGLKPEHRVLDIGSGIGNLAVGLLDYLTGGYDGIEIHKEAVAWCQQTITPRHPQFRFHRADVASVAYNRGGELKPTAYRFPFPDRSFDAILLSSVFTHMLPQDVEHYLREISRLLTPAGVCVASYFILNGESRAGVESGRSFVSFDVKHPSGVCRLHDADVPEAAVAYEDTYLRQIHDHAGLRIRHHRRGRWWSGEAHDQDVLTTALVEPMATSS
jgi:SAM-dependent methyltransferase